MRTVSSRRSRARDTGTPDLAAQRRSGAAPSSLPLRRTRTVIRSPSCTSVYSSGTGGDVLGAGRVARTLRLRLGDARGMASFQSMAPSPIIGGPAAPWRARAGLGRRAFARLPIALPRAAASPGYRYGPRGGLGIAARRGEDGVQYRPRTWRKSAGDSAEEGERARAGIAEGGGSPAAEQVIAGFTKDGRVLSGATGLNAASTNTYIHVIIPST